MENFNIPQRYSETYDTLNKNVKNYTGNATNFINVFDYDNIRLFLFYYCKNI
jgi:hypothetical protein